MSRFWLATVLVSCLVAPGLSFASEAFGFGSLRVVTQSPNATGQPPSIATRLRCPMVFRNPGQAHILDIQVGRPDAEEPAQIQAKVSSDFVNGEQVSAAGGASLKTFPTDRPIALHRRLFREAMEQWTDHGYNSRQVELLDSIDRQLHPGRVHWIQFRFGQPDIPGMHTGMAFGLASIRIFDASQPGPMVLGYPVRSRDRALEESDPTNLREALSPIELSPRNQEAGYILPARPQGQVRPLHLWHLGIGTNVKSFSGGLQIMFAHVARLLDMHYNRSHWQTFGQATYLDKQDMWLISSAKQDLIAYYQKLGFEILDPSTMEPFASVVQVNGAGEAQFVQPLNQRLPDGMVLIGIRGTEFLKRYANLADVPHVLVETQEGRFELGNSDLQAEQQAGNRQRQVRNQSWLRSAQRVADVGLLRGLLEQNKRDLQAYFIQLAHFMQTTPELRQMDRPEREFFADHPGYAQLQMKYETFAQGFLNLVYALPPRMRSHEWPVLEDYATKFLRDDPLEAFQGEHLPRSDQWEGFLALGRILEN